MSIKIYTDGSVSRPRGGRSPGGWAYHFYLGKTLYEKFGGNLQTTNNRMELTAAIKALQRLYALGLKDEDVTVISDSQYVIYGASMYMQGWKRAGKLSESNTKLKNKDLWIEIDRLSQVFRTRWLWVRGHRGHEQNERCDRLAKLGSYRAIDIENSLTLLL
jgi:ribonuclease HI